MATREEERRRNIEWLKCASCLDYWIESYVYIFNATLKEWIMFALWPAQSHILTRISLESWLIVLKARQLGLSWLVLCYALHSMLFRPAATCLLFSWRDEEAIELLKRIKGIYERLPRWMQARAVIQDSLHDWELSNGSSAKSFPSTGGRSYTGSLVIVDEAEFVQDLDELLGAVKPTVDAGGQLILISTVDKSQPQSPFKRIYRGAKAGETAWAHIFLPWHARPERTPAWYAMQSADVLARTGTLDDLHQEYPATDSEALAPRALDKRIAPLWIEACYEELAPLLLPDAPALPGLSIYRRPIEFARYVLGADPAEGNPASDDSAMTVMDWATGEEVATMAGKFEPSTFAAYIAEVSAYFNDAPACIERNNHGHAVLLWLRDHRPGVHLLNGHDDKPGWMSSSLGKALLYTECADHFRQSAQTHSAGSGQARTKILHNFTTYQQLASIEGATLRAPKEQHDDRADSFALAHVGRAAAVDTVAMHQAPVLRRGGSSPQPILRSGYRRIRQPQWLSQK